jgi:hypothetical protein
MTRAWGAAEQPRKPWKSYGITPLEIAGRNRQSIGSRFRVGDASRCSLLRLRIFFIDKI